MKRFLAWLWAIGFIGLNLLISSSCCGMTASTATIDAPKKNEVHPTCEQMQKGIPARVLSKTEGPREEKRAIKNYCINLMWINKKLDDKQPYIYPTKDLGVLEQKFLDPIYKWAAASRGSVVNIWYDSEVTLKDAVENTQMLIDKYVKPFQALAIIKLRDVRELPLVKKHSKIFSSDISVYFRADLLRPIIADHLLSTGETDCFVYADLDMQKPLSREDLFDSETLQTLYLFGIVLAQSGSFSFENSFQIISNHNKNLLAAIKQFIIDTNIQKAYNKINLNTHLSPQAVYASYADMFRQFYFKEGLFTSDTGFAYSTKFRDMLGQKFDNYACRVFVPIKKVALTMIGGLYE